MWYSDVTLRILIDDRYCGRIIGREGKTVKKIREDTGTRISISKYVLSLDSSTDCLHRIMMKKAHGACYPQSFVFSCVLLV